MRKLNPTEKKVAVGVGIGASLIGGIILYKRLNRPNITKQNKEFDKATIALPSGTSINVIETARQLGIDLGIAYAWYDPRRMTENDNAVKKLLLSIPKTVIPYVRSEYAKLYNRNLQEDLQKLLDDYNSVRYLFV